MSEKNAHQLIEVCFSSPKEARALLKKEPNLIHEKTEFGETPLHYLVVENQLNSVQLLVEYGANVNTKNKCGATPLSNASSLGYLELVKYLLSQGAKVTGDVGFGETTLHEGVKSGNPDIIKILIENGVEIEAQNGMKETALHVSASDDERVRVTKFLIEKGANINAQGLFSDTPLHKAALHNSMKNVVVLVEHGASLKITDSQNCTPSELAFNAKNKAVYEYLVHESGNPNSSFQSN
ncbi:hypothetical protein PN36_34915 [Candidatus Thiomargarita nelsonii]|uniref:Uncharacterized protein n=1 Tax=Candidatus Thiomargarita nelsonii TaxID=1003181 RepID=A0A4E0QUV5_9GAMM|nr:hypothetical protein PN36_34915 [Candidatus Thiomargarita nelsonii]